MNARFFLVFVALLFSGNSFSQEITIVPSVKPPEKIKIIFAGDVVGHEKLKAVAKAAGKKENYYNYIFSDLKDVIEEADLAFVNLETPISSSQINKPKPFLFNSSPNLVKALAWAGFDLVSVANNHALDQGRIGLRETISSIRRNKMIPIGAGRDKKTSMAGEIIKIKDRKIGFLAFTEFYNNSKDTSPKNVKVYLNQLNPKREVLERIAELKEQVDFLIVSVHWGKEYEKQPNKFQKSMAEALHQAGADILVGHHPHVLQPVQWRKKKGKPRTLTLYSLGNLVSNQSRNNPGPERDSALIEVEIVHRIEKVIVHPIFTYNWQDPSGIKTVLIDREVERLGQAIDGLEKSPAKSFLISERKLLRERRKEIFKSLKVQTKPARRLATQKK